MNPIEFWAGAGGDAYTARNRVDWRSRIPFWRDVLERTGARSVFELGCNAGWNLSAIRAASPAAAIYGADINGEAAVQACAAGVSLKTIPDHALYDLVFTAGVLIHCPPEKLAAYMEMLVTASAQYVLAIEYAADEEQEIEYRGERALLWRRPFGKLYQAMGLKLVHEWSEHQAYGFDNCRAWLLTKEN